MGLFNKDRRDGKYIKCFDLPNVSDKALNKSFKANVQVKDTSFHNARTYRKKGESKYQKVELEDIDFNKKSIFTFILNK